MSALFEHIRSRRSRVNCVGFDTALTDEATLEASETKPSYVLKDVAELAKVLRGE